MGLSCCVPGCNHKNGRELCSLYNFPNENDGPDWKEWYDLWCKRIGKSQNRGSGNGHSWMPTTWSRVCSCHFKEEERWKPRTRQPGLKFRAPVYFPFMSGASGSRTKSEPMNKTPLLAGLRVDTGMKSSLLAGLNVKIVPADKVQGNISNIASTSGSPAPSASSTNSQDGIADEMRKEEGKRENVETNVSSASKRSKTEEEDDDDDDVEMIEETEEAIEVEAKKHLAPAKKTEHVKMMMEDENKRLEPPPKKIGRLIDGRSVEMIKETVKAPKHTNSPAMQVLHSSSASNSPIPINMSNQTAGNSSSAYSSLVQMNAKSQIPVLSMSNRTVAPQSKYAELLAVIEDMGRDIRPTYSGSRTATERLKRGIVHARALVRECLAETERSARS